MSSNFYGKDGFTWFTGVVEDRNDPLKVSRVRVRCVGYHTQDKTILPTTDLPWASVMMPVTSPSMGGLGNTPSFLVEGSWVVGFFRDPDYQEPIVMGSLPGIPSTAPDSTLGFNDPNATYPSELNVPDTSSLARGTQKYPENIDNSIGIPVDPYAGEYPKNHVYETESGHLKEYDDTPNKERIRERHKSGTFYEIHPNGDKVTHIVNNRYTVVATNDALQVKGNVTMTVEGDIQLTAATGTINIASGDVIASGISLVNHTHTDTPGLGAGTTTKPNS
jgi:hypothetical protein